MPDADAIVTARYIAEHDVVMGNLADVMERDPEWKPSSAMLVSGVLHKGDIIPMRFEEANGRPDFEVVTTPAPAAKKEG